MNDIESPIPPNKKQDTMTFTIQFVSMLFILTLHGTCRNIVATVNLDCRLDLKTIALHARNAEYNPKVHTVVI